MHRPPLRLKFTPAQSEAMRKQGISTTLCIAVNIDERYRLERQYKRQLFGSSYRPNPSEDEVLNVLIQERM